MPEVNMDTVSARSSSAPGQTPSWRFLRPTAELLMIERQRAELAFAKTPEQRQMDFERYKVRLDFWKFVLGSVVAGIAIALIPPLFQYGTAYLEQKRGETYLRNDVVRQFVVNALDKDIENRIRLAHYFSSVADKPFRDGWESYHANLLTKRKELQKDIIDYTKRQNTAQRNSPEYVEYEQRLVWLKDQYYGYRGSTTSPATAPDNNIIAGQATNPIGGAYADR